MQKFSIQPANKFDKLKPGLKYKTKENGGWFMGWHPLRIGRQAKELEAKHYKNFLLPFLALSRVIRRREHTEKNSFFNNLMS